MSVVRRQAIIDGTDTNSMSVPLHLGLVLDHLLGVRFHVANGSIGGRFGRALVVVAGFG